MLVDPKWQRRLDEVTPADPVSRVLWDAANIMDKLGWCSKGAEGADGSICPVVAIARATPGPWSIERECLSESARQRLRVHISGLPWNYTALYGLGIIEWNESVCQSKEQAVAALRGAAYQVD